jgi:hypothetical protein
MSSAVVNFTSVAATRPRGHSAAEAAGWAVIEGLIRTAALDGPARVLGAPGSGDGR